MGFLGSIFGGIGNILGSIPGIGTIGDIATSVLGAGADVANAYAQQQDNEAARAWQSNENRLSREFNAEQSQLQRDWASDMWNKQNAYNTPSAQVRRLQQAGINPAAAFSNGVGSSGSSSILPQGSNASSSVGAASYPLNSPARISMDSMSARGAYIKSLAGAARDLSQRNVNQSTVGEIEQRVKNLISEERLTDLKSTAQDLANNIVALTGHRKASAEIHELMARAGLEMSEHALTDSQKYLTDEKWFEQYWRGFESKMRALLGEKSYKMAELDLMYYKSYLENRNQEQRSRINVNNASAKHYNALSVLDNDQHAKNIFDRAVTGFDENGRVSDTRNFNILKDAVYQQARSLRLRNQISESQLDEIGTQIEKLQKDIDWYEFNTVVGGVTQIIGTIAETRKAGALGELFESQSAKYRYEMEHPNVDTHSYTVEGRTPQGRPTHETKTRVVRH